LASQPQTFDVVLESDLSVVPSDLKVTYRIWTFNESQHFRLSLNLGVVLGTSPRVRQRPQLEPGLLD